jgi:hypothetical protein
VGIAEGDCVGTFVGESEGDIVGVIDQLSEL